MLKFINLKAVNRDLQLEVRDWRNSAFVAKFFQIPYIDLATHEKWLQALQEDNPRVIAFIIEWEKKNVGLVYFSKIDFDKKKADWGIYIKDENLRGLGIGRKTLEWSFKYAKTEIGLDFLELEVLSDNFIAKELYEKMGFQYDHNKNEGVCCYKKNLTK